MKINFVALLGIRLLALFLITTAISEAGSAGSVIVIKSERWGSFELLVLLQVMLPLLVGVWMFTSASKISKWLIKDMDSAAEIEIVDTAKLQVPILIIAGIFIVSFAIPELILNIYANYIAKPFVFNGQEMGKDPNTFGRIIAIIVKIIIGYYLTFHSSQLLKAIENRSKKQKQ